jgi:hypothetical protein
MSVDKVYVNGNGFDFGSVTALIDGDVLNGFKSLNYSEKRERTFGYGAGKSRTPRVRTRGKYSAEASLTLFKDSAESFRQRLAAKANGSYGSAEFSLSAQYFENGSDFVNVQLVRCCIAANEAKDEEGTDPLYEDFPLSVFYITKNGLTLFDSSGGGIAGVVGAIVSAVENLF